MKKFLPRLAQLALTTILLTGSYASFGQDKEPAAKKDIPRAALDHLRKNKQALRLTDVDIADVELSRQTTSKNNGVQHVYLQQMHQGIAIHNAIANVNLTKDGQVLNMGNRFEKNIGPRAKSTKARLTAEAAVSAAARHLRLPLKQSLAVRRAASGKNQAVLFSTGGISLEPIPAKLVYQPMPDGSLRLAWEVTIYELNAQNWWVVRVDATTGEFLEKDNLVVHCEFENDGPGGAPLRENHSRAGAARPFNFASVAAPATNTYTVWPLGTESPNHGPRAFVSTNVADPIASPSGWHTTMAGGRSDFTRGNNVQAYEDPYNNSSLLNHSPNGGSEQLFDYPVDFTKQPVEYRDAAITNLFYWNNLMHDIWYQYGFDEASANFQYDNFDRGGLGGDGVRAEAQDSRNIPVPPPGVTTRNNANFGTPPDGNQPRMQMYLWSGIPDPDLFRVIAPSAIAGRRNAREAAFGPRLTAVPVTGKLVLAVAAVAAPTGKSEEGCGAFANADSVRGNIAVVYRGSCPFADKVQNAQLAGAIAVVVINNAPGDPIVMGGAPTQPQPAIAIPAVMIGQADGKAIRDLLDAQTEVVVALKNDGGGPELDGDFDNGIIAHEYGHGISNRLTGGGSNVTCLNNAEQAGEGWSDWFGLMLTTKPGETGAEGRGIGTYVSGQPTTGRGIRPAPYSTDFAVNNFTYAATNNVAAISQPHGIGFVWATMLWDLNWALVAKYGYNADLYHGKGGNNLAMQLIIDGLKLQVCQPGFVDSRDAILAADVADNGGLNQELIWRVFAKRGLGFSAKQGLSTSRTDQVEAFDVPPTYACSAPTIQVSPATAGFAGAAPNTIYLGYGTQAVTLSASSGDSTFVYTWAPASGLSDSTSANPVFTPTAAGTYTFMVTAVNGNGCTRTASVTIEVVDPRCGRVYNTDFVQVCYRGKTLCVPAPSVSYFLRYGGVVGKCQPSAPAPAAAGLVAETKATGPDPDKLTELTLTASPNPASTQTTLAFTLPQSGSYRLEVLNLQGSLVSVVAEGSGEAGARFSYEFRKGHLASGVYMARLVAGKKSKFTRIILQD